MFDMRLKFSLLGFIIFMIPMVINIIYVLFPPANTAQDIQPVNKWLEGIEQSTRVLYAVAMCILVSNKEVEYLDVWFYLGAVFLVLYYIAWIRYFIGGRKIELLGKNFFFVPMPLAIFPVLYYIFAAIWVHNWIAVVLMIIFGIAHNIISYESLGK